MPFPFQVAFEHEPRRFVTFGFDEPYAAILWGKSLKKRMPHRQVYIGTARGWVWRVELYDSPREAPRLPDDQRRPGGRGRSGPDRTSR